jgi:hypothetical protein
MQTLALTGKHLRSLCAVLRRLLSLYAVFCRIDAQVERQDCENTARLQVSPSCGASPTPKSVDWKTAGHMFLPFFTRFLRCGGH